MNKTLITICFFTILCLGIIGATLVLLFRPEAIPEFTNLIVLTVGFATTGAVTFAGFKGIEKRTDSVEHKTGVIAQNVNGNITKLVDAVRYLMEHHPGPKPMTHDELDYIQGKSEQMVEVANNPGGNKK